MPPTIPLKADFGGLQEWLNENATVIPMTYYVVAAHNYEAYIAWCRRHNLAQGIKSNVRFLSNRTQVTGVDYYLVYLPGWENSDLIRNTPIVEKNAYHKAKSIYFSGGREADDDTPVVNEDGQITDWRCRQMTTTQEKE